MCICMYVAYMRKGPLTVAPCQVAPAQCGNAGDAREPDAWSAGAESLEFEDISEGKSDINGDLWDFTRILWDFTRDSSWILII